MPRFLHALPLVAAALLLAGCDALQPGATSEASASSGTTAGTPGTPLPNTGAATSAKFARALVVIDEVFVQSGAEQERPLLLSSAIYADLAALPEHVVTVLGDQQLPTGAYDRMRVVVSAAFIEVEDGPNAGAYATHDYYDGWGVWGSPSLDGLIEIPEEGLSFDVALGEGLTRDRNGQHLALLDFDLQRSFAELESGGWALAPAATPYDLSLTGSVKIELQLHSQAEIPEGVSLTDFSLKKYVQANEEGYLVDSRDLFMEATEDSSVYAAQVDFLMPGEYDDLFLSGPQNVAIEYPTEDMPDVFSVLAGSLQSERVLLTRVEL